jgi:hypothetical protein
MSKNFKKLIRKKLRLGLKKAYFFSALISIIFNTTAPILLSYNYVAYAQDTQESSVSQDTSSDTPAEETVQPEEQAAPEVTIEEVTPSEPVLNDEQAPATISEESTTTEETTSPSETVTTETISTDTSQTAEKTTAPADVIIVETEEVLGTSDEQLPEGDILEDGATDFRLESSDSSPPQEVLGATDENGHISTKILEETNAASVDKFIDTFDLSANEVDGLSAKLFTDKADYAPTDTAIITGTGFLPEHTYRIIITSDNLTFKDTFKTDDNGEFIYTYQLDGKYRPLYFVEIKDGNDEIATISFTDSPISGTTIDSGGANDEPGQKDLTQMSVNYTGLPTSIDVTWNWDEKGPGGNVGGNTGDACSLYDTDNDGLVNYSLCVIIDGDPSVYQSKVLYSCSDAKADRCTNPVIVSAGSVTSSCTANVQNTDPFATGTNYPQDSVASCTINMSDVGGAGVAELVDVCSYPSQQPNSDPSDCIVFRDNTGRLEVIKDLIPSDNTGKFNLQIDGVTQATDVGDAGTTGEKVVTAASHTVGEIAGTGTSLSSYSSTIVCKDLNGSGTTVASGTNSGPLTVTVAEGDDIVCTITNTLLNGTIAVHKDVQGPNGEVLTDVSQNFTIQLDDANSQLITDGGTVSYSNVASGSHTITESVIPAGYSLYSMSPDANGLVAGAQVTVTAGQTTDVYLVNRQQNATVTVHKNVINPDGGEVSDSHSFTAQKDGGSEETIAEGTDAVYTVVPGSYIFTEVIDANYTLDSITGDNDTNPANGALVTVGPAGSVDLTFVNKQKKATITVVKDVLKADGSQVADNNSFEVTLNGETKNFSENSSAVFTVNPGEYSAV